MLIMTDCEFFDLFCSGGLGLYIAKGIMIQHDGSITASSEGLGCGTIFEMNLPLWEITSDVKNDYEITSVGGPIGEQTDKTGTMSFTHDASLMLPKAKLKILVVDDVKSNRKLLMRLLENKGHSCDEAENGEEAVELVRKAGEEEVPYDTILLDYEMPVMDGPNAAKVIRHTLLDDETNIIGVTGNVLPEDVEFFRRCGANDVLGKPVKIKELQNLWQKHCILLVSDES
jgi:CheY-like chemotaxis protein